MFRIIQNGLYEGLQGGVARFEIVDIFLVNAFSAMVRVWVIDAFGTVYGGTGGAARSVAIALGRRLSVYSCKFHSHRAPLDLSAALEMISPPGSGDGEEMPSIWPPKAGNRDLVSPRATLTSS